MDFLHWDGQKAIPYRNCRNILFLATLVAGACATKSGIEPTMGLQVTAISPNVGSTTGSTRVTITGNDFTSDATVTIGGMATTNVVFQSSTQLMATTGAGPAGTADVVVTAGGRSATLTGGFGFIAPTGANQPPVIVGIRSVGSRPGQPSGFADQDETVTLVADATDAETPSSELTYLWTGPGSFGGTTATTPWHLPATVSPTPAPVAVTLTAVETYSEGKLTHTNTSEPRTFVMQVHDSQKEVLDMGQDFLTLFSQSNVPTNDVLHNFSATCDGGEGRASEKTDVDQNRTLYTQDFSAFKISRRGPAIINFHSVCVLPDGRVQANVDACSSFAVHWEVIKKSSGVREITNGIDYVSAVVENNNWRLCHSDFIPSAGFPTLGLR
jgi:hypothetical protein